MISATLKGYGMYRNDVLLVFDRSICPNIVLKKAVSSKILLLHNAFQGDLWGGIRSFLLKSIIFDGPTN